MIYPISPESHCLDLPKPADFTPAAIERWFANIPRELELGFLTEEESRYVHAYYSEAGLLRRWRRPFFLRHFAETIAPAAAHLLRTKSPRPTILDLGCGVGSQSLFFALNGAHVLAVDMDEIALDIFRKRQALYSELTGQSLDIEIVNGNVFDIDYASHAPIHGVYSLFAFNMMQPSGRLLDRLVPHLEDGAQLAVLDGNQSSLWSKLLRSFRRSVWLPKQMCSELEQRGFTTVSQKGGVALPPVLWAILPYSVANRIDQSLVTSLLFSVSYQTLATFSQDSIAASRCVR